jgi:NAD(P)-dependent dehydrogenase (short-subunit alcohol dehydrogenase family)
MINQNFSVDGSTAIVTGASSGIGAQIARQFTARGVDTVICSREQENVDAVADEIHATETPGDIFPVECDVRDRDAVDAMVTATIDKFGGLDILINNAGAAFRSPFDDLSENAWKTIIDINLNGIYNCTSAASDALKDGGGYVVNISSVAGSTTAPERTHYAAAKAGVNNLTRTLATEWAPDGVRVTCIAPGYIATEDAVTVGDVEPDSITRESIDRRIGTTEEIADLVEFLVSPASSFIIGQTITAKGVPIPTPSPVE